MIMAVTRIPVPSPDSYGVPYGFKVNEKSLVTLYRNGDSTNCKLSYIQGAGSLHTLQKHEIKEVLESILDDCKGAVFINTTSKIVSDAICEFFPTYYKHEVPIGYGEGFQYHMLIKNTRRVNTSCRTPNFKPITKKQIGEKLKALLKSKKRKDDYVEEFLQSLNEVNTEG